eukprot:gene8031-12496_t
MPATNLKQLITKDGHFFNLMNYLVKGSMMTSYSASILTQSISRRKEAIAAEVSQTQFIGRSSDNLCVVHATLPCKIFKVELNEKLKKMPKKFQQYYISAASSDALQKARRVIFEEEESIRKEYMTKLYEVLNKEAGKDETLIEGFGPNSSLLDPNERDDFDTMNLNYQDAYEKAKLDIENFEKVDLWSE